MNMQMRSFSYRTIRLKFLSNFITDNVKTCHNNALIMVLGLYQLFMVFVMIFPLFLRFSFIS